MSNTINTNSHRRYNILTGEWVLVSPHRTKRPWQGKQESTTEGPMITYDENCYLCPGNTRANGEKNPEYTDTFVFQNDFAALLEDIPVETVEDGLLKAQSETGICKVICFSPNHSLTLPLMEVASITKVVQVWKQEYAALGALEGINHVQIFENKGAIMGCSNPHPHGQVWSQLSIPEEVQKKGKMQKAHWEANKSSLLSDYLTQELASGERIVAKNEHFVALIPYWAVWPYEAMIVPIKQHQNISSLSAAEEVAFADMIKVLTTRYDNLFETSFPYSSGIHQSPTDGAEYPEWHFHMSFYPPLLRSASVKKFMVGYEMFANPQRDITAELAAETLRGLPEKHYKL